MMGEGRFYTLSRYQWSWVTFLYASEYMPLSRVVFVIYSCPRSQWSGPLKLEIMLGGCYVITVLMDKLRKASVLELEKLFGKVL